MSDLPSGHCRIVHSTRPPLAHGSKVGRCSAPAPSDGYRWRLRCCRRRASRASAAWAAASAALSRCTAGCATSAAM